MEMHGLKDEDSRLFIVINSYQQKHSQNHINHVNTLEIWKSNILN